MPLTEEIQKDPAKAYEYYVNNIDKCKIKEIELGKTVIYETDKYIATVDDDSLS